MLLPPGLSPGFFFGNVSFCVSRDQGLFGRSLIRLDPNKRVALSVAWPDGEAGEGLCDSFGQFLDAQSFRCVMAGGEQADAQGLGFKRAVEPRLAGQEDVGARLEPHP